MSITPDATGPASHSRQRNWALAAALAFTGFVLATIWVRTGLVPAPSGGDEVWWGEAAYHWLNEGTLRWACMDDIRGSGAMTFWPPIAALLEAACFKVFGLNAFGLMVQSSLVATLIMAATYQLSRLLGFAPARALLVTCALFGLMTIERRLLQVRMENLTALCLLAFVVLWLRVQARDTLASARLAPFLSGLVLGIGLFCYYPQSPFLLLSAVGFLCFLRPSIRSLLALSVGLILPLLAGAIWILPHWELFQHQILSTGAERFFALGNLVRPFSNFVHAPAHVDRLILLEKWFVLGLGVSALWRGSTSVLRGFGWIIVIGSLPMFCFDPSPQVFPALFAVCLIFHPQFPVIIPIGGWLVTSARAALPATAGIKLSLIVLTGFYQFSGRDYDSIAVELRASVDPHATIGISQEAWLALRAEVAPENLHLLVHSYTTRGNLPRVATNPGAADYFDYLILRIDRFEAVAAVYPWIKPAIAAGKFRLVHTIAPPFRPLPWARTPIYNLAVYQRVAAAAP